MRIRFFALLALLLLRIPGLPAWAEDTPRKWALVVGVDRYDNASIAALKYAGADAREVAQVLHEAAGFPSDQIVLLSGDGAADARPTRANLLAKLERLRGEIKPGDSFIFYFAGRGAARDDRPFLLTCDTNPASIEQSSLAVRDLQQALSTLSGVRVLEIVDARDDAQGGRGLEMTRAMTRDLVLAPKGAEIAGTLFACSPGQQSYEGYKGHGYFTWFLVEGLRGGAALDGKVTLASLIGYLGRQVPQAVRLHEKGRQQTPFAKCDGAARWVLASGGAVATSSPTPTTSPEAKPDPSLVYEPYVKGSKKLGFSPSAATFDEVLAKVHALHFEAPADTRLYAGVVDEVKALLHAAGVDDAIIFGVGTNAETPRKIDAALGNRLDHGLLWYAMIRGMLKGTGDPYTVYMTPAEMTSLLDSLNEKAFGGIGIYLEFDKAHRLQIVQPIDNTPAARAGLLPGDHIDAIDGTPTAGLDLDSVTQRIRGRIGTAVTLTLTRGNERPFDVTLQRASIAVTSVTRKMLPDGIAYVQLRVFGAKTGEELTEALQFASSQKARGLIVDLRNNGGGYVTAAVDVCSAFLGANKLVTYTNDKNGTRTNYQSKAEILSTTLPMVLLVNEYSASASEITAGCMKTNARATLVGHKTFGKGSVQTFYPAPSGAGLKITIAHFYTPSGGEIHKVGVVPDVEVAMDAKLVGRDGDVQLTRAIEVLRGKLK